MSETVVVERAWFLVTTHDRHRADGYHVAKSGGLTVSQAGRAVAYYEPGTWRAVRIEDAP